MDRENPRMSDLFLRKANRQKNTNFENQQSTGSKRTQFDEVQVTESVIYKELLEKFNNLSKHYSFLEKEHNKILDEKTQLTLKMLEHSEENRKLSKQNQDLNSHLLKLLNDHYVMISQLLETSPPQNSQEEKNSKSFRSLFSIPNVPSIKSVPQIPRPSGLSPTATPSSGNLPRLYQPSTLCKPASPPLGGIPKSLSSPEILDESNKQFSKTKEDSKEDSMEE